MIDPDSGNLSLERRLGMALAAGHMGFWELDLEEDRARWSPETEALLGFPTGTFPPSFEAYLDRVHPDDRILVEDRLQKTLADPSRPFDVEHRILRPDETCLWVHCTAQVQRDENGRATEMVGTITDVTEHKSLEERLREAQRMQGLGQLAGSISHDFNNILTVILGELELLQADGEFPPHITESLRNTLETAQRGHDLTSQLLDFARDREPDAKGLDAREALQRLFPLLQRLAGKGNEVEFEAHGELGEISLSRPQLEQVLMNLVVNAKEAMEAGDGNRIRIDAERLTRQSKPGFLLPEEHTGPWLHLIVSDAGSGLDERVIDRVFRPFFTTKKDGTGLGLSTCDDIVGRHGGRIWCANGEGGGAVFHVLLPARDQRRGAEPGSESGASCGTNS